MDYKRWFFVTALPKNASVQIVDNQTIFHNIVLLHPQLDKTPLSSIHFSIFV
jgi:hypothetical protein